MKSERDITRYIIVTLVLTGLLSSFLKAGSRADDSTEQIVSSPANQQGLAANGKIAFVNGEGRDTQIVSVNPDGSDRVELTLGHSDADPAWSPDGTRIAFARSGDFCILSDIYVMNADGTHQQRLTSSGYDRFPAWSPDGTRIAFARANDCTDSTTLFVIDVDGGNLHSIAGQGSHSFSEPNWTPDGSKLVVSDDNSIYLFSVDGSSLSEIIPSSGDFYYYSNPVCSPDGSKIAFSSAVDCYSVDCSPFQIWTANADGTDPIVVANEHTQGLNWSPDGTKLVLSDGEDLFVMDATGGIITNISKTRATREFRPSWQSVPLAGCADSISDTGQSFDAGGGTGRVDVNAANECAWQTISQATWITLESGIGSGNGTVLFSVGANTSTASRTSTLVISGRVLTINQAGLQVRINSVLVLGKGLILSGENFDPGAVILLNGQEQKTRNDDQNPKTMLIGKKAGKRIKPGDTLQVRNPNGTKSEEITFTGI